MIDTGGEVTVLSQRIYNSIPLDSRPVLYNRKRGRGLILADEKQVMKAEGVVDITLMIGNSEFEWPVYVASISDDMLLGCDIFDNKDITLNIKRGLQINGQWVKCETNRKSDSAYHIKFQRAITIPGNSQIEKGYILEKMVSSEADLGDKVHSSCEMQMCMNLASDVQFDPSSLDVKSLCTEPETQDYDQEDIHDEVLEHVRNLYLSSTNLGVEQKDVENTVKQEYVRCKRIGTNRSVDKEPEDEQISSNVSLPYSQDLKQFKKAGRAQIKSVQIASYNPVVRKYWLSYKDSVILTVALLLLSAACISTVHSSNNLMFEQGVNIPMTALYLRPGRQEKHFDVCVVNKQYKRWDLVYKRNPVHKKHKRWDLVYKRNPVNKTPWRGPHGITGIFSTGESYLEDRSMSESVNVHHDLLKPYTSDDIPRWLRNLLRILHKLLHYKFCQVHTSWF